MSVPAAPPARFTRLRVVRRPGERTKGLILFGPHAVPCALGRSGLTRFKREGDGATPAARMRLLGAFFRDDRGRRPPPGLASRPIRAEYGWSDDVGDHRYNRLVRLPFRGSHEELARPDGLYDVVVVLDWNVTRRALHRGSAIFFHLARPDYTPTAGCVAVSAADMRRILALVGRGVVMSVG